MNPYRLEECPPPPFWVATRTVSVACPPGMQGEPVVVTREAASKISLEHAEVEAERLARCEALSRRSCCWAATAAAVGSMGHVETASYCSPISLDDAKQKALELAKALANQFKQTVAFTANCIEGTGTPVTVTRTAYSYISNADAYQKAYDLARAEAEAALVCI